MNVCRMWDKQKPELKPTRPISVAQRSSWLLFCFKPKMHPTGNYFLTPQKYQQDTAPFTERQWRLWFKSLGSRTWLFGLETWIVHSSALPSGASYSTWLNLSFLICKGVGGDWFNTSNKVLRTVPGTQQVLCEQHLLIKTVMTTTTIAATDLFKRLTVSLLPYILIRKILNRKWTPWRRWYWVGVKNHAVWMLVLPLTCCVTPGKVLNLPKPGKWGNQHLPLRHQEDQGKRDTQRVPGTVSVR